ncbi:Major facilitator-type transporter hxnP [Colletotrichum siamense]|uniref:Major facilitator-type transporter hxnP n=1 Tax=Colletotrichum siamense TaxID=690259 RepID=A0A9P5BV94_COLSI|nr:Major facilitator-type transporter hxnP [Colletotrichum siamense]KAF4851644.1 Major facilitator-type transporter hxnP [Colletotrichum siamense]
MASSGNQDIKSPVPGETSAFTGDDGDAASIQLKETQEPNRMAEAQAMSEEEIAEVEKKLKRKLDFRLLTVVWIIFILNYLDRKNIAAAKVAGIKDSLRLDDTQYETAVSILFVGYILMQIPSNIYLTQIRPSLFIPACVVVWGGMSAATGAVTNLSGLYAIRFFLGIVEAAFLPGALFLISSWYKRDEMGFRGAILFSGSQLGSAFSGLIGAGIQHSLDGAKGLESWRWLFIIEGCITIFVGVFAIWLLPDWPSTTSWLTPKERAVAEWRLVKDAGQVDEDDEPWSYGFKLAFMDWRIYLFTFLFICIQVCSAVGNFFPDIVDTLGYGRVKTLLLTAPPYLVSLCVSIANNYSADRTHNASFHIIWPMCIAIMGYIIAATTLSTAPRYFSMFCMTIGAYGTNAVLLAWVQKTMIRPRIKRASAVAIVNALANTSQVWTSYLYPDSDAPHHVLAMSVNASGAFLAICTALVLRFILLRYNKQLASGQKTVAQVMKGEAVKAIAGVTLEENERRKEAFRFDA